MVFTCKPPRGIPKPEVTWKKDNMAVVVGKEDEGGRNFKMADDNFGDSEKSEMSFEIGKDFDGQKTKYLNNGETSKASKSRGGSGRGVLKLGRVVMADSALYTCVASNVAGVLESKPAVLHVKRRCCLCSFISYYLILHFSIVTLFLAHFTKYRNLYFYFAPLFYTNSQTFFLNNFLISKSSTTLTSIHLAPLKLRNWSQKRKLFIYS